MGDVAPPRIKVCCIASVDEARLAIAHGAAAIGLVSAMPSGPGVIDDALIGSIAAAVAGQAETFLLTSRTDPLSIAEQHRAARTSTIQLCDRLEPGAYARIRDHSPGVRLVQVIHVTGEESIGETVDAARHVDAILLDSGNQSLAVKELGGTGRRHDWRISRRIRDAIGVPVWLAGGLRPDNVGEAIAAVQPHGLDVCSGLRTGGALDPAKLGAFAAAVASAAGPRHPLASELAHPTRP